MTWPQKIELRGWGPHLEGVGDRLTLVVGAARASKDHNPDLWRGELRLTVDRWFVRQLCQAVADMQTADRNRIAEETLRLSTEISPLTVQQTKEKT